jgi:hypothetical protein
MCCERAIWRIPTLNGGNAMRRVQSLVRMAGIAVAMLSGMAQAQADRYDALANSAMFENRPTPQTGKLLKDELLF